ncbi:hypothetical protein CSV71_15710 [Sporosarcina sp. P21c]|nr:hypothetical protein CSV78_15535 [Sporosarcina sp. P16a]PIC88249.1 hypothetical protein CSV71_15710 [Sporosarcina sp. P21c]PIC94479.1 hypothetical protein CSV70_01750 [Sporosarcina sp. P25]
MSSRPWTDALISAKHTEIRQSEPFAVHLARATPSGKRPQLELPSPHTHKLTHHSKALALELEIK